MALQDYEEAAAWYVPSLWNCTLAGRSTRCWKPGAGGGANASFGKEHYGMVLVDLSADMLQESRRFNRDSRPAFHA